MPRHYRSFDLPKDFSFKLRRWAAVHPVSCLLDSNSHRPVDYPLGTDLDLLAGIGCAESITYATEPFNRLQQFHSTHNDWLFGQLSYDLKNDVEQLESNHPDRIGWPMMYFFIPEVVVWVKGGQLTVGTLSRSPEEVLEEILATPIKAELTVRLDALQSTIRHADYIRSVLSLKHHIQLGDIYEVNFCQEFSAHASINRPILLWEKLIETSPVPFSAYLRVDDRHLLCASPERYLRKKGTQLLAQPIKGTAKRSTNIEEDKELKKALYTSEKERSENVMIVDLMRNDLSRIAQRKSVRVGELFGVYSFPQVHQMISSVAAELRPGLHFTEALKASFPMGSMTGAPKVKAMELIESYESVKRGLYSGSVGYITPEGDFDFNVVIRSINYNSKAEQLSYLVGGAITAKSDPEQEFQECKLKAKAIERVLEDYRVSSSST